MSVISMKQLLEAGVHFGHQTYIKFFWMAHRREGLRG